MFVHASQRAETLLVPAVGSGQETRLPQQPLGSPVAFSVEALDEQLFVPSDALPLPSQLIVEPHHLGDEAGTQLKRRRGARADGPDRGRVQDDFPLARREQAERHGQAGIEEFVQLLARDDCRVAFAALKGSRHGFQTGATELSRGAAGRHDDGRRPNQIGRTFGRTRNAGTSKRVEVGDANQPRPAGGHHRA